MQALYAGLMAWTIELTVAFTILYILKKEESKVLKRRRDSKSELLKQN
jgi:hypothetical protein|tara:strand:+ start:1534 stop:1677 length:144 start_codon:yes stop_codon:yes gene_type:complete